MENKIGLSGQWSGGVIPPLQLYIILFSEFKKKKYS